MKKPLCQRRNYADRAVVEKKRQSNQTKPQYFQNSLEKVPTFSYNKIVTYKEQGRRTRPESVSAQR